MAVYRLQEIPPRLAERAGHRLIRRVEEDVEGNQCIMFEMFKSCGQSEDF